MAHVYLRYAIDYVKHWFCRSKYKPYQKNIVVYISSRLVVYGKLDSKYQLMKRLKKIKYSIIKTGTRKGILVSYFSFQFLEC